jgi:hypothetical protein
MKKILAHVSYTNKNYISMIKYLTQNNNDDMLTIAASLHGNIFDAAVDTSCDYVLLSIEEYTQEFHDFVNDTDKKVFIFIDKILPEDVIRYLSSKSNVRFIAKSNTTIVPVEKTIFYDKLYDSEIFVNTNTDRTNQIAVLLSKNNQKNEELKGSLYPISDTKIICFNNPNFDHPQNIGVLSDVDTSYILNKSTAVLDIDNDYQIEAQACGCSYIQTEGSIQDNLKNNVIDTSTFDLKTSSFYYYITQVLVPYILGV